MRESIVSFQLAVTALSADDSYDEAENLYCLGVSSLPPLPQRFGVRYRSSMFEGLG
jgi:hypothetical protein